MNEPFPIHTPESAPESSKPWLEQTQRSFGMIPNLEAVMASAPTLLQAYSSLWSLFDETSLSPVERQVVYQTVNFENGCEYCVPWHSLLSEQAGMSDSDIDALRDGRAVTDTRLEALRNFTRTLLLQRGKLAEADLDAFLAAGFQPQQALEVILGIAIKTMSNYTNSIAGTPLDEAVADRRWRRPLVPMRGFD
ncbi:MAG: carboxymuconolactone decarboxylase family protein [Chromatiales bacterium]